MVDKTLQFSGVNRSRSRRELSSTTAVGVQIITRDGPGELPATTLARVVGCVEKVGSNFQFVKGSAPVRAEQAKAEEIAMRIIESEDAYSRGEAALRRDQIPAAIAELTRASGQPEVRHLNYFIDPIPTDATVVRSAKELLFIGRMEAEKGVEYLLEAMPLVLRADPAVHLSIVGGGALAETLRARAAELGLGSAVSFIAHVPRGELGRYYSSATACASSRSSLRTRPRGSGAASCAFSLRRRSCPARQASGCWGSA